MPQRDLPRFALWILERRVPAHEREFVVGDLVESWRASGGGALAYARLLRECLALLLREDPDPTYTPFDRNPMSDFGLDVLLAVRRLRRAPGFTLMAALTIALGTGAAVAIASVARPVFWGALPFARAEQIVTVRERFDDGSVGNVGFTTISDLGRRTRSFTGLAAVSYWSPTLSANGRATRLSGSAVSAAWFEVMGIRPALGRTFRTDEDSPNGAHVAVLTDALWRTRFGSDSGLVGRTILLDGIPTEVVGVLPPTYESVLANNDVIIRPLRYTDALPYACRDCRHLKLVARVRGGVSVAEARRDVERAFAQMSAEYPTVYGRNGIAVTGLREYIGEGVRGPLLALLGAAALLLVVALANTVNLLVARALLRQREGMVRTALGARRWRLLRGFLVEATLVALLGALFGTALARASLGTLLALAPASLPRYALVNIDGAAMALSGVLGLVIGIVGGMASMGIAAGDGTRSLMGSGRTVVRGRHDALRRGLVVAQVAMAMVLLTGGALLVQSVRRLLSVDPGFATDGRLTMALAVSGPQYREGARTFQAWRDVTTAVRSVPGVTRAALVSQLPLSTDFDAYGLRWDGLLPRAGEPTDAFRYAVSAEYADVMGIRRLAGRFLEATDVATSAPVVVVSRSVARRYFGDRIAGILGARVQMGGDDTPWRTVVGVVDDVRHPNLDQPPGAALYLPFDQNHFADGTMRLVVLTSLPERSLMPALTRAIAGVDPIITIDQVASLDTLLQQAAAQRRFAERLFQAFSLVALLLSAVGLTGIVAALVGERVREIGVRSALGATRPRILAQFLGQGGRLAGGGILLGVLLSLGFSRSLQPLVYGVSPKDPLTLGLIAVLLGALSLIATFVPAWRATRVDAAEALRSE